MSVRPVQLRAEDAVELTELLAFMTEAIEHDTARTDRSSTPFASGFPGYRPAELAADCRRFAFLLGGSDPRLVFGEDHQGGGQR